MINNHSVFYEDGTIPYNIGITTGEYDVSGVYSYIVDGQEYNLQSAVVTSAEYIKHEFYQSKYINGTQEDVLVYSYDMENTIIRLNELGYNASNIYLDLDEANFQMKLKENANIYLMSLTGIIVSSLSIFFIMRSSLISRVYEVSVYRSLGASKNEIRKMFLVEVLVVTSISTLLGYIFMTILLMQAESSSGDYVNLFKFTFMSFSLGLIGIYVVNVIFGLAPINVLLRKTPSEIIKKHDL